MHLVEELVSKCNSEDLVLDPFCGTGTTALACAQRGITCHTVDINPFLVWLANVKCASYSENAIEIARTVLDKALADVNNEYHSAWVPPIKDINKWWEPDILKLLSLAFEQIRNLTLCNEAQSLLYIIFCRCLIELSSASFGHQSMSFKKDTPSAYLFEVLAEMRFRNIFQRIGSEVLDAANEALQDGRGRALPGDSRRLEAVLPLKNYTSVITSPPYPNRMSYIRELRPYMYWLGYLESGNQAGELDWQAIGGTWGCATSKLMNWTPDPRIEIPYEGFDEITSHIAQHSQILSLYVTKYFEDTIQHVRSLKNVLASHAQVHYIVGNSKFYDVVLPTEQLYAAIFEAEGFHEVSIETIRKRTSKKELFEYVVSAQI
ncbi:MAG: DNA methyltransferase [Ktedonobacteraceae bacterium]